MRYCNNVISEVTEECGHKQDINKKILILYRGNSILPRSYQLSIPTLIRDDYIDRALDRIDEKVNLKN
ncbi:MAG TPA: hypothetical protein VIP70_09615 [Nitrososphaeraceae archaeon]